MLVAVTSSADVTIKSDVVYGHKDGMALVYDVLMPDSANGAAILFMMSGGWYSSWAPPETRARQFKDMLDAGFTLTLSIMEALRDIMFQMHIPMLVVL